MHRLPAVKSAFANQIGSPCTALTASSRAFDCTVIPYFFPCINAEKIMFFTIIITASAFHFVCQDLAWTALQFYIIPKRRYAFSTCNLLVRFRTRTVRFRTRIVRFSIRFLVLTVQIHIHKSNRKCFRLFDLHPL
eukprot:UN22647